MGRARELSYFSFTSLTWSPKRVERSGAKRAVIILTLLFFSVSGKWGTPPAYAQEAQGSRILEARQLLARQKWDGAVVVLRALMKEEGLTPAIALDLSKALAFSGRREESLALLEQAALRARKGSRDELMGRARVISRIFLTETTFQLYQDGVSLLSMRKFRPARERFEKALEHEPDNVEILARLGQCMVLDDDFDSAVERLKLAARLNPYEPELQLWLGEAHFLRGEKKEALKELQNARAALSTSERATLWLASALDVLGQRLVAIQLLEKDIKAQPFHVQAIISLADLQLRENAHDAALLWSARQELQLAQSRLEKYSSPETASAESDLGLDMRRPSETLKSEILHQLAVVDERLDEVANP